MSEKGPELLGITNGHATFDTNGFYRVVYHGDVRRDIYHPHEMLSAEDAIFQANLYNKNAHTDFPFTQKPRKTWAEAVSYEVWEERYEKCDREEHRRDMQKVAVDTAKLKWKRKEKKLRKKLKRLQAK